VFRRRCGVPYTEGTMTVQRASNGRASRYEQGRKALMCSRVAQCEVQINGIPKASMLEVASTA
jgi:hypothetical protein